MVHPTQISCHPHHIIVCFCFCFYSPSLPLHLPYIVSLCREMEVEGPEGNPSSAWSPSYPARAEVFSAADGADHITTPGSSEENTPHTNTMGQSTLEHQSSQVPPELAPSRGDHQAEERPAPDTADLQGREDHSPVRDHQEERVSVRGSATSPKENAHGEVPAESTTPNSLQTIPPPPPVDHQVTSEQPQLQKQPPSSQLCGYLHKLGGPLKAWKLRWFTYEEKKSQLFYYRTAQDVAPLGRVELRSATLGYPLKGESGTFHIQTPERTFVLKVRLLSGRINALLTGAHGPSRLSIC